MRNTTCQTRTEHNSHQLFDKIFALNLDKPFAVNLETVRHLPSEHDIQEIASQPWNTTPEMGIVSNCKKIHLYGSHILLYSTN